MCLRLNEESKLKVTIKNHEYINSNVVKMIIPKGAYYIIGNEGDEIVSNILI